MKLEKEYYCRLLDDAKLDKKMIIGIKKINTLNAF